MFSQEEEREGDGAEECYGAYYAAYYGACVDWPWKR